ncbi:uncharacterized protein [Manis javanica]|uniref:uncharacterized protein isoform X1 n=1 Tax=Manis javanica TaxID=9974 RepID=UPI00187A11E5|nr:collagen alpha-1(III) chain-like [Manis javanica]
MPQALTPAPGAASPRFPRVGLSSGPRNQPSEAASGRLGPPVRSSPWTPASGDGRGPRRPPPRQLRLGRRHCAPPATPAPDLPVGESGVPGQRPRARGRAPRRPEPVPGTQSIRGEAGRGETPADCRGSARPVAGVAGTWLSLSTEGLYNWRITLPPESCHVCHQSMELLKLSNSKPKVRGQLGCLDDCKNRGSTRGRSLESNVVLGT